MKNIMQHSNIYEEFHNRRNRGNDLVLGEDFLPFKRFYALDNTAYSEGELSAKNKELIGLACSLVLRCNDCVYYHIEKSLEAGAQKGEIIEAMNISLVIGGSIVIPHLRAAMEALDELIGKAE